MVDLDMVTASTWLTPGAKIVYVVIRRHRLGTTNNVHVTQRVMAAQSGISYRSIRNHVSDLIECGLIERRSRCEYILKEGDWNLLASKRNNKTR